MGLIPEKKEYKNFTYDDYLLYTEKIDELGFVQIIHTPYSAKNHFDKFGYLDKGKKVVVVYDVKGKIMSVTAHDNSMKALDQLAKGFGNNANKSLNKEKNTAQSENLKPNNKQQDNKKADNKNTNNNKKADKKQPNANKVENKKQPNANKVDNKKQPDKNKVQNTQPLKQDKKKQKESQKVEQKNKAKDNKADKNQKSINKANQGNNSLENKKQQNVKGNKATNKQTKAQKEREEDKISSCVINQYYPLSFNNAMQSLRNIDGIVINTLKTLSRSSDNETIRYAVSKNGNSGEIEYMIKKGTLTIKGGVTDEIKQVFLALGGVEKQTNLQQNSNTVNYEKILSTHLNSALKILTTSQKNDLGAGFYELEKAQNHYEYSMFLLSPFKCLENFIFDLLKSENIQVKLIGQAYDKDKNGNHELKECYKNRCKVVYSEVLCALYEEYYSSRNHYTHSPDGKEHKISKKAEAQKVLNQLMGVLEYNCKKLEEINYTVKR